MTEVTGAANSIPTIPSVGLPKRKSGLVQLDPALFRTKKDIFYTSDSLRLTRKDSEHGSHLTLSIHCKNMWIELLSLETDRAWSITGKGNSAVLLIGDALDTHKIQREAGLIGKLASEWISGALFRHLKDERICNLYEALVLELGIPQKEEIGKKLEGETYLAALVEGDINLAMDRLKAELAKGETTK